MKHVKPYMIFESDLLKSIGLRFPDKIEVSEEDKKWIKDLTWKDFDWEQTGDNGRNIVWLEAKLPIDSDITKGIVIDVQIIRGTLYQVHIHLSPELRGLRLAPKIYRSLVSWLGHIYSSKGRRQNPLIDKVLDSLRNSVGVECIDNELGTLCVDKSNEDAAQLINYFKNIGSQDADTGQ